MFTVYRFYTATGYTEFRTIEDADTMAGGTLTLETLERLEEGDPEE